MNDVTGDEFVFASRLVDQQFSLSLAAADAGVYMESRAHVFA